MRCPCQTLLEVPPTCRHIALPPLSRPVTKRTELADRNPPRGMTNAAEPEAAIGAARYLGTHRSGSGGKAVRAARRGLPSPRPVSRAALGGVPGRIPPHLISPHLTPPARRGAPRPRGAAPPPTRRPPPAALTPRAPAAAASHPPRRSGRPARGTGPGGARPPLPKRRPLTRSRRGGGAAPEEPGSGGGRPRPGLWAPGTVQPVSRSRHLRPLGLLGAPRWRLPLAVPTASQGSVSFCGLPPGLFFNFSQRRSSVCRKDIAVSLLKTTAHPFVR